MNGIITRSCNPKHVSQLLAHGIHPILARLYAARGFVNIEDFSTRLIDLHTPFELLHIQTVAKYLANAISEQKKIVIIGDYDCDGATACATGLRGLRRLGAIVDYLVPNRLKHGYGLTPEIVELAVKIKSPNIILTVDNGITSIDGVIKAQAHSIDVIITDHHLPNTILPPATVIVNPNQPHCKFLSKNLSGVGVIFYVLLALRAELRQRKIFSINTQPKFNYLLGLVALGTVADVVKLDPNNRILVAQGLKQIRANFTQVGISALFHVAKIDIRRATSLDLGFAIGPRLNAAGRLSDMSLGVECLITEDTKRALIIAKELNTINCERQHIAISMETQALSKIQNSHLENQKTISIFHSSWHPGVIGILASRLKDKFNRPSIVFAPGHHDLIIGSGRSIKNFHIQNAIDLISKQVPSIINTHGGHAMAAGLTIHAKNFKKFSTAFEAIGKKLLGKNKMQYVIETDGVLEEHQYTLQTAYLLQQQIWGSGLPIPLFYDYFTIVNQRYLKQQHLKLLLKKNKKYYEAIWFKHAPISWKNVVIVFELKIIEYAKFHRLQLIVHYVEEI